MADIWAHYAGYSKWGPLPKGLSEYRHGISRPGEPSSTSPREPVLQKRREKRTIGRGQSTSSVSRSMKRQRESPPVESASDDTEVPLLRRSLVEREKERMMAELYASSKPSLGGGQFSS